jgi:hypothetical protein
VPAAAVIPAPIAYIKVVAVKKLVVGFLASGRGRLSVCACDRHPSQGRRRHSLVGVGPAIFTLKKLECLKQALCLNTLAWNNE